MLLLYAYYMEPQKLHYICLNNLPVCISLFSVTTIFGVGGGGSYFFSGFVQFSRKRLKIVVHVFYLFCYDLFLFACDFFVEWHITSYLPPGSIATNLLTQQAA